MTNGGTFVKAFNLRLKGLAFVAALMVGCSTLAHGSAASDKAENPLLYATAWKQTAAEYRALYYQGFNIAREKLEAALAKHKDGDKPLAIVTDVDDTVLLPLAYWRMIVKDDKPFFDDPTWDAWVPKNEFEASPGSLDFLKYADEKGIEIFYVTSRDQGERTTEFVTGNLRAAGFPLKADTNLTVLRDTSNKEKRQDEILAGYDVVVFLGDNLNDFRRKYYLKGDVPGRIAKMEEDKALFGNKYIIFPNPTDGHWMAAIFGTSEPEDTPENRATLRKAAE